MTHTHTHAQTQTQTDTDTQTQAVPGTAYPNIRRVSLSPLEHRHRHRHRHTTVPRNCISALCVARSSRKLRVSPRISANGIGEFVSENSPVIQKKKQVAFVTETHEHRRQRNSVNGNGTSKNSPFIYMCVCMCMRVGEVGLVSACMYRRYSEILAPLQPLTLPPFLPTCPAADLFTLAPFSLSEKTGGGGN